MEIATGYFSGKEQALEAAQYLRSKGLKSEISLIGHYNQEDFHDSNRETDDYLIPIGISAMMFQGTGFLVPTVPFYPGILFLHASDGLFDGGMNSVSSHWGLSKDIEDEIKSVVDSGNTAMLIEFDKSQVQMVYETLKNSGAQNIHI